MATSVASVSSVRDRRASPITRLYRPIAASTLAQDCSHWIFANPRGHVRRFPGCAGPAVSERFRRKRSGLNASKRETLPPPSTHPEFWGFPANPCDEAIQLWMFAQHLNCVVPALQFLFGEYRMDRGMTDPVQRDSLSTVAASRHEMMLVDAAAGYELAPAQRAITKVGHHGSDGYWLPHTLMTHLTPLATPKPNCGDAHSRNRLPDRSLATPPAAAT